MYKRVAQIERIEEWCGCESVRVGEREGGGERGGGGVTYLRQEVREFDSDGAGEQSASEVTHLGIWVERREWVDK